MIVTEPSYCRLCSAFCGILVDVEDGRSVAVRGDRANPLSQGYICVKGRALAELTNSSDRITEPQRRTADDNFNPIELTVALDQIAAELSRIIDSHGPRSVAVYRGTAAIVGALTFPVIEAWVAGIGTSALFSPNTIDQPAKLIAPWRHGAYLGGKHSFDTSDVWIAIGHNPLVSHMGGMDAGIAGANPGARLNRAKTRGLKLIVIDPRMSETARRADVHLRVRPGEDAVLLAGMVRLILEGGCLDRGFVREFTSGLDQLKAAVEPFTLERVANRTGIALEDIRAATRMFAAGPRGGISTGTGVDMGQWANLSEHLVLCLLALCGRYSRAGEQIANPGVLARPLPRMAQVVAPSEPWKAGDRGRVRVRELGNIMGELPAVTLPEEILTPGAGQVRALIVVGGNPAVAVPDQKAMIRALEDLELLVALDPFPSATARLAHYIVPPTMALERADFIPAIAETMLPLPYSQFTRAVSTPPAGTIDEWRFFWELAHRMGTTLNWPMNPSPFAPPQTHPIPTSVPPEIELLMALTTSGSRVPLAEVMHFPHGHVFADPPMFVTSGAPDDNRLALAPSAVQDELEGLANTLLEQPPMNELRLICTRLNEVINSTGTQAVTLRDRRPYNPAIFHPSDLALRSIKPGTTVEISSPTGKLTVIAEASETVPRGVVSMAHCWGGVPQDDDKIVTTAHATSRLIDPNSSHCPVSGIPTMTGVNITVRPLQGCRHGRRPNPLNRHGG